MFVRNSHPNKSFDEALAVSHLALITVYDEAIDQFLHVDQVVISGQPRFVVRVIRRYTSDVLSVQVFDGPEILAWARSLWECNPDVVPPFVDWLLEQLPPERAEILERRWAVAAATEPGGKSCST